MAIVAVIGASADPTKFGNKALRAFRHHGDTVIPDQPEREDRGRGAGLRERAGLSGPDRRGDGLRAAATSGFAVIEDIAKKGIKTVWLNPGADGAAVVARARALGLATRVACSMLGIGERPGDY